MIMTHFNIAYREKLPGLIAYHQLFETTGWNQAYRSDPDELYGAISSSWYVLSAYDNDDLVGFGRVISDGVLYALICDLIVRPSYQGQGLGSQLLNKLIEKCHLEKIRVIWLFSAKGKSSFYKKFGFLERPVDAPGMQLLTTSGH
jgi:GNAT superfamily N-acetyltransferase